MPEKRITRVGDLSIGICSVGAECCPHCWISVHIKGSPDVNANSKSEMRVNDIGISTCPHCVISYAKTGSALNHDNKIRVHRVGDIHIVPCGTGVVITGSPDVFSQ